MDKALQVLLLTGKNKRKGAAHQKLSVSAPNLYVFALRGNPYLFSKNMGADGNNNGFRI